MYYETSQENSMTNPPNRGSTSRSRSPSKSFSKNTSNQPKERPPDAEIQQSLEEYLETGKLPEPDMKEYVFQLINRLRVRSLLLGQYNEAKKLDYIIKEMNDLYKQEIADQVNELSQSTLNEKRQEYQQKWNEVNEKWQQKIEQQKNENQKYLINMENRQNDEILQFRKKWQTPEFIESFNKPSNVLLNLRYQETKLALMRNYDEAAKLRELANKRQIEEENEMRGNMQTQMRREYFKIKERHDKERDSLEEHQQKTLEKLESQRIKDLKEYQVSDRPPHISRIQLAMISNDRSHVQTALQTPRTATSLAVFRNTRHARLNLDPMNDDDFSTLENESQLYKRRSAIFLSQPQSRLPSRPMSRSTYRSYSPSKL